MTYVTTAGEGRDEIRPGRRSRFRFTQTPQWALLHLGLSDAGYRTYSLLLAHVSVTRDDNDVWVSQQKIGAMLGKRREAISRIIAKELAPLGLVDVTAERYGTNNSRKRNIYTVHEEPPPGWSGWASISEWHAANKQETAGQPGRAKNRTSGGDENRASGRDENRTENYTKVELHVGGSGPDIRPSVTRAPAKQQQQDGGKDGRTPTPQPAITRTEGTDFLQTFALQHPAYTLTGKTLRDQALTIDGLLAAGWTQNALYAALISRPLPAAGEITTSPGAILAARLRDITGSPVPTAVPTGLDASPQTPVSRPTASSADKTVAEGKRLPVSGECVGQDGLCGRPTHPGHTQCASCLGYERCWECGTGWKHPNADACQPCLDDIADTLMRAGL